SYEFSTGEFRVRTIKLRHPGTTLGFRLTPAKRSGGPSMAYVTDNELGGGGQYEVPASWRRDFVTFLKGVDLLIHDAMYTPKELEQHRGWGHSTYEEAVTLAPVVLGAQQGGRNQGTRPGIAVLPFNNGGSYGQGKEDFDALERGIAGMMISELSQNPAARVVERQEVQRLVDEQNLGAQGRVDPQTASKSGSSSAPAITCSAPSSIFTATS